MLVWYLLLLCAFCCRISRCYDHESIFAKYTQNPKLAENNNFMGILKYEENQIMDAVLFFKKACELDYFKTFGFIQNLVKLLCPFHTTTTFKDNNEEFSLNTQDLKVCFDNVKEYAQYLNSIQYFYFIGKLEFSVFFDTIINVYQAYILSSLPQILKSLDSNLQQTEKISEESSYLQLIHTYHDLLILILKESPDIYLFWLYYVDFINILLTNLSVIHNDDFSIKNSLFLNSNTSMNECEVQATIDMGLMLFPNSPELLYIKSLVSLSIIGLPIHMGSTHNTDSNVNVRDLCNIISNSMRNNQSNSNSLLDLKHAIWFLKLAIDNMDLATNKSIYGRKKYLFFTLTRLDLIKTLYENYNLYIQKIDNDNTISIDLNDNIDNDTLKNMWSKYFTVPYSLHLGCSDHFICPKQGYIIIDAQKSVSTHIQGRVSYLQSFQDNTVKEIYSSHTLEHLSFHRQNNNNNNNSNSNTKLYQDSEDVCSALIEWRRVMIPKGRLRISVPDVDVLYRLYLTPNRTVFEKKILMNIIYGGQDHEHNYHKIGFSFDYLKHLLENTGFCDIKRVPFHTISKFNIEDCDNKKHEETLLYQEIIASNLVDNSNLSSQNIVIPEFSDTSYKSIFDEFFSLNVVAYACPSYDKESIDNCKAG